MKTKFEDKSCLRQSVISTSLLETAKKEKPGCPLTLLRLYFSFFSKGGYIKRRYITYNYEIVLYFTVDFESLLNGELFEGGVLFISVSSVFAQKFFQLLN